ncbi:hypothetical protein [Brevundimonas vesicularis]|uniref:hypothetical protein n=1 Tax=Brevundimonas vesicularis TaxID=41276 RepID=UPI00384D3984
MTTPTTFPVPEFSDVQIAFGASQGAYLTREQMGDDFYCDRNDFTRHAQGLFFNGGPILPAGRRWKPEIDRVKAARAIKALLSSFDPKHEVKIGTVGFALCHWTVAGEEPVPAKTPHQAQRKKARKPKGKGRAFARAAA